jgi:glycerol transport system ATP-binding protein
VVYATTEPQEALLLGGHTVVMDAGRILQAGPTLETYGKPASIRAAAIFNDPPMNVLDARIEDSHSVRLDGGPPLAVAGPALGLAKGRPCKVGIRCHHVALGVDAGWPNRIDCTVDLSELSGSETYVHLHVGAPGNTVRGAAGLVAQVPGVHAAPIDSMVQAAVDPAHIFIFDADGALLRAPQEHGHGAH